MKCQHASVWVVLVALLALLNLGGVMSMKRAGEHSVSPHAAGERADAPARVALAGRHQPGGQLNSVRRRLSSGGWEGGDDTDGGG